MKKGQQYIKYQQQAIDIKKPSDIEAIHNIFQSKVEVESKLSNK